MVKILFYIALVLGGVLTWNLLPFFEESAFGGYLDEDTGWLIDQRMTIYHEAENKEVARYEFRFQVQFKKARIDLNVIDAPIRAVPLPEFIIFDGNYHYLCRSFKVKPGGRCLRTEWMTYTALLNDAGFNWGTKYESFEVQSLGPVKVDLAPCQRNLINEVVHIQYPIEATVTSEGDHCHLYWEPYKKLYSKMYKKLPLLASEFISREHYQRFIQSAFTDRILDLGIPLEGRTVSTLNATKMNIDITETTIAELETLSIDRAEYDEAIFEIPDNYIIWDPSRQNRF